MRRLRERVSPAAATRAESLARHLPALLRGAEVALGVAALGYVGFLLLALLDPTLLRRGEPDARMAPIHVTPSPRVIPVLDAPAMRIPAGEHVERTFRVEDPRSCTLTGRVAGLRGGSRDVEVFLLDDGGYADWHDGIPPRSIYYSGRTTSATLRVPLPGRGQYHLLVSNRYSLFTDKVVEARNVKATCR